MKDEDYNKYVRFDHAAANTEPVPFVTDEKIYTIRDKEQLIAAALSARDREIREVLSGFIHAGIEHDDPRMDYVVMQIDRRDLETAKKLLKELNLDSTSDTRDQ